VSGAPHRPPPWPRFWRGRLLCARLLYWRYGWDSKDTRLTSRSLLAGRSRVFGACRCQVVGAGLRLWLEEILGVLAGFLDLFAIAMSVRRPFCQQELLQSKSLTRGIMIAGKAARQETKRRKLIARRQGPIHPKVQRSVRVATRIARGGASHVHSTPPNPAVRSAVRCPSTPSTKRSQFKKHPPGLRRF